jgi:hypothetical protein
MGRGKPVCNGEWCFRDMCYCFHSKHNYPITTSTTAANEENAKSYAHSKLSMNYILEDCIRVELASNVVARVKAKMEEVKRQNIINESRKRDIRIWLGDK